MKHLYVYKLTRAAEQSGKMLQVVQKESTLIKKLTDIKRCLTYPTKRCLTDV